MVRPTLALPLETLKDRATGDALLARFGLDLDCALLVGDGDFRDRLPAIDTRVCPLYLLTGEYDYSVSPEDTRAAAERIAGVKFTVMPKLGHFPMSENPALFLQYLRPVLDEIRKGG